MERATNDPSLRLSDLRGVNERVSRDQIPPGQWEILEGMYPARSGMLERIPGKQYLANFGSRILAIHPTNDGSGNILIQTENDLQSTTLDELYNRVYTPSINYLSISEEDTMSMAVIVQRESNGVNGGSPRGYLTGTDSGAAVNTFYGRRLTHLLVNESSTVQSFTASTGGAGAVSTAGQFVLTPGTYRIRAVLEYGSIDLGTTGTLSIAAGLYNTTAGRFEYHNTTGGVGTDPIVSTLSTTKSISGGTHNNIPLEIAETSIYISAPSGNQTYEIRHAFHSTVPSISSHNGFGGLTNTNLTVSVNGSAVQNVYAQIVIKKVA